MGYVFAMGSCLLCGQLFTFNPNLVPSFRVPGSNGSKEPICRTCLDVVNKRRVELGHAPFVPLPGAYEPCDETEL